MPSSWLPEPIVNSGDIIEYIEMIYQIFQKTLNDQASRPRLQGVQLKFRWNPIEPDGKPNVFWHLSQESKPESRNKSEEERFPDFERMSKLCWIKPIIDAVNNSNKDKIFIWKSTRPGENKSLITLLDYSYIVVIVHRDSYDLLLTAYPVTRQHRRNKLKNEHEQATR